MTVFIMMQKQKPVREEAYMQVKDLVIVLQKDKNGN